MLGLNMRDTGLFVTDLNGKTVATQQGSYMHRYLVGQLDAAGLSSSVKITYLLVNNA
jgi:NitT/TauT family transport system substrate-binding protein/sulfonate transport system substrate-binding protein